MKTEAEQTFIGGKPQTEDPVATASSSAASSPTASTTWQRKKKSWSELREDVRTIRRKLWGLGYRLPHSFTFRKLEGKTRIYFMSSPPHCRDNSVFAIDVPDDAVPSTNSTDEKMVYPWLQVLVSGFTGGAPPTKEELLLMERKRMTPTGIAAYEFHEEQAKFVFTSSSSLYQCVDDTSEEYPLMPTEIKTPKTSGARLNAEICPINPDLIAFVNNGDIWVVNSASGDEEQLTICHYGDADLEEDPFSAGLPSYIMQEEFNRFQGFWWQPCCDTQGVYRIFYEEVDETNVNVVNLLTVPGRDPERYRFPVPGTPNASSTFKFVEFQVNDGKIVNVRHYEMLYPIKQHFAWAEYIVRAGWTPDGKYIWLQLLNRQQQRLELVLFPFLTFEQRLKTEFQIERPSAPIYVVYSETTDIWINVHDILTFLPCEEPDSVMFLWASEESGYRHLYIIKSELRPSLSPKWHLETSPSICLSPNVQAKIPLTKGNWEVMNAQIAFQYEMGFLFFMGLHDTPIERHLYAVCLQSPGEIRRLTTLGYSYSAFFNADCSMAIITYSSTQNSPVCQLFRIKYTSGNISGIVLEPLTYFLDQTTLEHGFTFPEIYSYKTDSGLDYYAMVYKPFDFEPSKKYPTILNVYGGPEVQLVYNSFRGTGQLWLYLLASQGYCVVAIDSRGSHHRGINFESHIRGRMGTVELKDQVEVLTWLSEKHGFIDLSRVGIYGWSYGGYLSLMGLAHYPALFKVAVAGAPVTSWELYDTGYTERYMDLPENNPHGYREGSVLSYIQQFPDDEGRLLLVHGVVDENVHFTHTVQLINSLIRSGKPYQLQLYPNERHSLRRLDASEHYETTLLSFLQRNLL